jgi:cytochrome c biogenesis protein CcdA
MLVNVILTAFLITLLEAVCTGQVYLPVIALVFRSGEHFASSLLYLLWYNLVFVMPLLLIWLLVYAGVTSKSLSDWLTQNSSTLKLLLAAVYLIFAVIFMKLVF